MYNVNQFTGQTLGIRTIEDLITVQHLSNSVITESLARIFCIVYTLSLSKLVLFIIFIH